MPRSPIALFRDPGTRPRAIVWTGVAIVLALAVLVGVITVTSTRWFCGTFCHQVQGDPVATYYNSSHTNVSCLACHMPVNADPVTFLIHKAENAIVGGYQLITGTYEVPHNPESELAMDPVKMPERQCTQCHSANRLVTPTEGILIDHVVHSEKGHQCTVCHNRVAHDEEGVKLTSKEGHEDFMKMDACYRCHSLEKGGKAPGECAACHPPGFELKPANHDVVGFYEQYGNSKKHAQLAKLDEAKMAKDEEAVSYCGMCHVKSEFCDGCHGVPMPHPAGFSENHGDAGKKDPQTCANCHASEGEASAEGTIFCDSCHHKGADPTEPWIDQHWQFVRQKGATACFECHEPSFCAECHVKVIVE